MIRILNADHMGDILARRVSRLDEAIKTVRPIIDDVQQRGDAALHEYALRFDQFTGSEFSVQPQVLAQAASNLAPAFRAAVNQASTNIGAFAQIQLPREHMTEIAPGIAVGQIVRPLASVAAYIPTGRYPLSSTLLMTAIPAIIAGVPQICVTSSRAVDEVDGVAHLLGLTRVFRLGGAHAIAAFAFGTSSIPKVERIVGPGNIYVAAAKKLLSGEVGIDFVAGPTEVLIIAEDADPIHLAADMLAQAEHDVEATSILLTTSPNLARKTAAEIERQLTTLSTRDVASLAIANNSAIVVLDSLGDAIELANRFAPEHLSIYDDSLLDGMLNAGSVFVGPYSPEAAGDYAAGPNHVLPTGGHARLRAGLSTADFVKVISVQRLTAAGLQSISASVTTLARAEGLEAHARSIEVRTAA